MADMQVNRNAALEAARRQEQARIAAEQARQAAAERARLQAEEARAAEAADKPDTAMYEAVAAEYHRLGAADKAEAVRLAGNPALSQGVRKELTHALQDGDNTDQDLRQAAKATQTLQVALAQSEEALTPEQQQAMLENFQRDNPELAAVEQAEKDLAAVVATHQGPIADALKRGEQFAGMDAGKLEDALAVAAKHPEGAEAAEAITIDVLANAESIPEDRLRMLSEQVLPKVVEAKMQSLLDAHDGDAKAASQALQDSDLGKAIVNVQGTTDMAATIRDFGQDLQDLNEAVKTGNATQAADVIDEAAAKPDKLSTSLAGLGVVTGLMAFQGSGDFTSRVQATLETGEAGAEVAVAAAGSLGKIASNSKVVGLLEGAGPVLGIIAGTISGIQNLKDGNYVAAAADGATVALGIVAATASVPGVNLAAGLIAGGMLAWDAHKNIEAKNQQESEIRDLFESVDVEAGKIDFMVDSRPGAYKDAKDHLGLDNDQIDELIKGDSAWGASLDAIATPDFKKHILPMLAPGGKPEDVKAALDQLEKDFSPAAIAYIAETLADTANRYETNMDTRAAGETGPNPGTLESTLTEIKEAATGEMSMEDLPPGEFDRMHQFIFEMVQPR